MIDISSRSNNRIGEGRAPQEKGSWATEAAHGHGSVCCSPLHLLEVSGVHAGASSITGFLLHLGGLKLKI